MPPRCRCCGMVFVGYAPPVVKWKQEHLGVTSPATAVSADPLGVLSEHFMHSTWAEDFVFVANNSRDLRRTAVGRHATVHTNGLRIADPQIRLWALERLD